MAIVASCPISTGQASSHKAAASRRMAVLGQRKVNDTARV
jgi:hypothetical protein